MSTIESLLKSLQTDAPVLQVLVGAFWTAAVLDVPAALRTVGQGATFPQIRGKRLLTMMREGRP